MKKRLIAGLGLAVLAAMLVVPSYSQRSAGGQTHMQQALADLQAAKNELQAAEADKGGHRGQAIEYTNQAMQQVREGIEYANTHH